MLFSVHSLWILLNIVMLIGVVILVVISIKFIRSFNRMDKIEKNMDEVVKLLREKGKE